MNQLIELIDERIKKNNSGIKTLPCVVLELKDNEYVKVATLLDGSIYTVQNQSGSDVEIGETVQLAYTGMLSNSSGYIIASKNKSSGKKYINIPMNAYTGALFSVNRTISSVGIKTFETTDCVLNYNCNTFSSSNGEIEFEIEIDDVSKSFKPKISSNANYYNNVSFSIPITLSAAEHSIKVLAKGDGSIAAIEAFVGGHGLEVCDYYDDTGDNDYIFITQNNKSDVIYYIGNSNCPRMPVALNNADINKLYSTAFNYSSVELVYVPEGITEIR